MVLDRRTNPTLSAYLDQPTHDVQTTGEVGRPARSCIILRTFSHHSFDAFGCKLTIVTILAGHILIHIIPCEEIPHDSVLTLDIYIWLPLWLRTVSLYGQTTSRHRRMFVMHLYTDRIACVCVSCNSFHGHEYNRRIKPPLRASLESVPLKPFTHRHSSHHLPNTDGNIFQTFSHSRDISNCVGESASPVVN